MDIIYKVQTDKSFANAIEDLKALGTFKFGVLWELNFQDKLKEKGLELDKNVQILEVCNPGKAKKALDTFIEAGIFLPCKMIVYEKNHAVYIGMLKPTELIGMLENDDLLNIAREVEIDLKSAIDTAR
jgi:uncharacterized protein (DUF302 family)